MKRAMSMSVVGILLALCLFFAGCLPNNPSLPSSASDWTVMVFMNGDNDLAQDAWQDFNSMEMVGSTDRVNIVVQMDTPRLGTYRYLVTQDTSTNEITSPVLESLGNVDMGNYNALIDFVRFCVERYPAKQYALILWNHGGGFRGKDISFDFSSGNAITIPQLGYALSQIRNLIGKKVDLLGMDACLMAMVEVAYEVRDYADLLVASEEYVPGEGWDYVAFLSSLVMTPSLRPEQLARVIVDTYVDSYTTIEVTQSVVDLEALTPLVQSIDALSQAVLADTLTPPRLYLEVGDRALYFGDYDFVDLGDLARLWQSWPTIRSPLVKERTTQVANALAQAVVYERNNAGKTLGGLSIYFPYQHYDSRYDALAFASSTSWDDMLKHLFRYR